MIIILAVVHIPFQYEENSAWKGSMLPHLSTNTHNNKMLHNKMTLPFLKQLVLALSFLWLKNAKLLNYKKLVLSTQFQIKHTKPFFRLSNGIFCLFIFFLIPPIFQISVQLSYALVWGSFITDWEKNMCSPLLGLYGLDLWLFLPSLQIKSFWCSNLHMTSA